MLLTIFLAIVVWAKATVIWNRPYMIFGMGAVNLMGIILFGYIFRIGILNSPWKMIFRIVGTILIVSGIFIWFIGSVRSDMDDHIENNKLKTNGIYAWVRNPMYSGWWIAFAGITLMWHNIWMLVLPVINWIIMTITLINSEEKWLCIRTHSFFRRQLSILQ